MNLNKLNKEISYLNEMGSIDFTPEKRTPLQAA